MSHHHVQRLVCLEAFSHTDDVRMTDGTHPLCFKAKLFQAVAKRRLGQRCIGFKGSIRVAGNEVLGAVLLDDELVTIKFIARKVHQTEASTTEDLAHGIPLEHVSVL